MNLAKYTRVPWAAIVFAGSLAYYLITSTAEPYPGASADFIGALAFPGQLPGDVTEPFGSAIAWLAHALGGAKGVLLATAAMGAWVATMLFVAAVNAVRHACLDFAELTPQEQPRARADIAATALLTGFGTVALALTALPLWALGTRPLPAAATVATGATALALASSLRRRCAEDYAQAVAPSFRRRVAMGLLFAMATFLVADDPANVPLTLAAIFLGGGILVRMGVEGRLSYVPWIVLGLLGGVLAAVGVMPIWLRAIGAEPVANPFLFWAQQIGQQAVPAIMGLVMDFSGAAPLALFALTVVLLSGCFPRAFLKFGSPLIGQAAIVALAGCCLARWPGELWEPMAEPTPLAALGVALAMLCVALLVGSWVRCWLDAHVHWRLGSAHTVANLLAAVLLGGLACAQFALNLNDGAGRAARAALDKAWDPLAKALPLTLTAWIDPEPELTPLFLTRLRQGTPIRPITDFARAIPWLSIDGRPIQAARREDVALDAAAALGPMALERCLFALDTRGAIRKGPLDPEARPAVEAVAAHIAASRYGRTPGGQRTVKGLRALAARLCMAQAQDLPPREAVAAIREALALNPGNQAAWMSLAELARLPEAGVTREERRAATAIHEEHPWLRHPTPTQAHAFEREYGPVRTQAFRSARRLFALRGDDRGRALRNIVGRYRDAPETLSDTERIVALTQLPKDEAATLLNAREAPSEAELEYFLCAWPWSPEANALYAKHAKRLAGNDCLNMLYANRSREVTLQRLGHVGAFFMRDNRYAYAQCHLDFLLAQGETEEALRFVSGFTLEQALEETPFLLEYLRLRVASRLAEQAPDEALRAARAWLVSNPDQPDLWAFTIGLERDPEAIETDVLACLRRFPGHPLALRLRAQTLRAAAGEAAARRWLDLMKTPSPAYADR